MSAQDPTGGERSNQPAEPTADDTRRRRVRVWFGQHVIAELVAAPSSASRYAEAMDRRFGGLRITNEPVGEPPPFDQHESVLWSP